MTDVGLIYGGGDMILVVTSYSHSDFAGDLDGRKSFTGYVFTLAGYVINWKASLRSLVALSTT